MSLASPNTRSRTVGWFGLIAENERAGKVASWMFGRELGTDKDAKPIIKTFTLGSRTQQQHKLNIFQLIMVN